jgi:hypothetical protein
MAAVFHTVGAEMPFTARELHEAARLSPGSSLAAVLNGIAVSALGLWLRRCRGRVLGPFRLSLLKRERGGRVWAVSVSEDRHQGP